MIAEARVERESVADLRDILGHEAQLLRFPLGAKAPYRNLTASDYQGLDDLTIEGSEDGDFNVAVLVGPRSGGIVTVDCDTDEVAELFKEANENLCENTLVTTAARGCNYWFKLGGECPKLRPLTYNGKDVGEFRSSEGEKLNWTIIRGDHPDGFTYTTVNHKPVKTISINDLTWIDGRPMGEVIDSRNVPLEALEALEASDVKREREGSFSSGAIPQSDIDEAVADFVPKSPHQTNKVQFGFARRIKRLAQDHKAEPNLFAIGAQWYESAKSNLRTEDEQDKEGYIIELIDRYRYVEKAEGDALNDAWKRAQSLPTHPQVASAPPNLQTLQRLCLILAEMKGNGTFTLGGAQVIDLISNGGSQADNAKRHKGRRYLGALETYGVIKLIKRGHPGVCSTYQYLLDDLKLEVTT